MNISDLIAPVPGTDRKGGGQKVAEGETGSSKDTFTEIMGNHDEPADELTAMGIGTEGEIGTELIEALQNAAQSTNASDGTGLKDLPTIEQAGLDKRFGTGIGQDTQSPKMLDLPLPQETNANQALVSLRADGHSQGADRQPLLTHPALPTQVTGSGISGVLHQTVAGPDKSPGTQVTILADGETPIPASQGTAPEQVSPRVDRSVPVDIVGAPAIRPEAGNANQSALLAKAQSASAETGKLAEGGTAANMLPGEQMITMDGRHDVSIDIRPINQAPAGGIQSTNVSSLQKAVIHQVVAALSKPGDGVLQIRLDPPELGRISLHITATDMGHTATVMADKPDILDLMRRNEGLLQKELASAGFENLNLQFENQQHPEDSGPATDSVRFLTSSPSGDDDAPAQFSNYRQSGTVPGRLDVRL